MRRPLKPFVTEYKSPTRRQPSGQGEQTGVEAPQRSAARAFEPRMKPPEDSYEAAMRAADALFAAPSVQPRTMPPKQAWATESWPDESGDSPPDERPHAREQAFADAPMGETAPEKSGGRILRVLDEAPPPQFAALEIEHAPKRRGRKPGSKNKPKVPALEADAAVNAHQVDEPDLTRRHHDMGFAERSSAPPPASVSARPDTAVAGPSDSPAAPHAIPAVQQVAALQTPAAPRGNKRFSWVRDRPRPGEEWKRRRLPRVCW